MPDPPRAEVRAGKDDIGKCPNWAAGAEGGEGELRLAELLLGLSVAV